MTTLPLMILLSLNAAPPSSTTTQQRALRLLERVCEGGGRLACAHLGRLYELGRGVRRDRQRAVRLFHRACVSGSRFGCAQLRKVCGATPRDGDGVGGPASPVKDARLGAAEACLSAAAGQRGRHHTTEASILVAWRPAASG